MHRVQMHAGAISKLFDGVASVRAIIHSLKLKHTIITLVSWAGFNDKITKIIFDKYELGRASAASI